MAEIIKKEIIRTENGNLNRMCMEKGITIAELSRETGISEDSLNKFNRGERTLPFARWETICKYLDDIDYEEIRDEKIHHDIQEDQIN